MRTTTAPRFLTVVAVAAAMFVGVHHAQAQSRPISLADQRLTQRTIRTVLKTGESGVVAMVRIQANVASLLARLKQRGANDDHLREVADFYQRSIIALKFRQSAIVNRDANRTRFVLLSRLNHEDLLDDLESARDSSLSALASAADDAVASIDETLMSLGVEPEP